MNTNERVLVYGATGHTGRFVVDELLRRGLVPVLGGRDAGRLAEAAERHGGLETRTASVDDADALAGLVSGVGAVVNCAGPFLDTALPLARASVAAGAHYLDVTAEQPVVAELYRGLDTAARAAGVAVVPAMAFYGGLADLLVTTLLDGRPGADVVEVAIGLDHWWPTEGTRVTGERNTAPRQVIDGGRLAPLATPPATRDWTYPGPLGAQPVVELPFSEVLTIDRHLQVGRLRSYLNTSSLAELRDGATPPPSATDDDGRSEQRFVVEAVVRRGDDVRRGSVVGRDIYAVSAPIVVEGVARLLGGRSSGAGAMAPGQVFDAADVLHSLARTVDGFVVDGASVGR